MTEFEQRSGFKKGATGEEILDRLMLGRGIIPYRPAPEARMAHPFDRLCATGKKQIFVLEVKTKEARLLYNDTGFSERLYREYLNTQARHNIKIYMAFVDTDRRSIYGGYLDALCVPFVASRRGKPMNYPSIYRGIVYFPLELMKPLSILSDDDVQAIRRHSRRAPVYERMAKELEEAAKDGRLLMPVGG